MARNLGEAFIGIVPDTSRFRTELVSKLKAAMAGAKVEVPVTLDRARLTADLAEVTTVLAALQSKSARLKLDADARGALAAVTKVRTQLDALTSRDHEVAVGVNASGLSIALARMKTAIQQAGIADIADVNVSPAKIRGQLILIRRLLQQAKISDLLDVNINSADLNKQLGVLRTIAGQVPDINIGTNLTGLGDVQSKLRGAARDVEIDAVLDTSELDKPIAEARAKIIALSRVRPRVAVTIDEARLDAAIASAGVKVAVLQSKLSNLKANADVTAVVAKIAGLKKQEEDLAFRMASMESDIDIRAASTKILALDAEVKVLENELQHRLVANANFTSLHAQLALAQIELNKLLEKRDLDVKAHVDTSGITAATLKVKALGAALKGIFSGSGGGAGGSGGGGGAGGGFGAGFGRFNFWLGKSLLGISLWHVALSAALETLISVGTAAAAAAIGIAVMVPAAADVVTQLKNIDTVNETLGGQIPTLSRQFDGLAKSLAPQVIEAFGGAMNLAKGNMGAFSSTARTVVTMADDAVAKIDLWAQSQGDLSGILKTGIGFLSQFGSVLGHLGAALYNLFKASPGTAHVLLDIINGFTVLLGWASKLPAPLIAVGLAWHAAYVWGRLLIGVLSFMPGPLGNLGKALRGMQGLSGIFGKLSAAMRALGPAGLAAIAALGLAAYMIVKQWHSSSTSVQSFLDGIDKSLNDLSASQAFTTIPVLLGKINTEMTHATSPGHVDEIIKGWNNVGSIWQHVGNYGKVIWNDLKGITQGSILHQVSSLGAAVRDIFQGPTGTSGHKQALEQQKQDVANLNAQIQKLLGAEKNLDLETGVLRKSGYGLSQALTIMNLAGVKASDSFALMKQKVANLIEGFDAMSVSGKLLNSSVNALSFASGLQASKVDELNSAWDLFIQTVTGSETAFATVETGITGMFQAAGQAGVKLTDSNGKVSSSFGTLSGSMTSAKTAQQAVSAAQVHLAAVQHSGHATALQLSDAHARLTKAQQALSTAQQGGVASFTGLNSASLTLQQTFNSNVTSANSMLDALTAQTTASGLGKKGTDLLANSTKDLVAQMLPAAKGSGTLTSELYALAQRGGYTGANSFKALSAWVSKTRNPMKDLQGNVETLTTASAGLTKDVQNLTTAMGKTLTDAMTQAEFFASGGEKSFDAFAVAAHHTKTNLTVLQPSANAVAKQLLDLTHNVGQAKSQFLSFAIGSLGLSKEKAEALWNSFAKGNEQTAATKKHAHEAQLAFEKLAGPGGKSGLGLTKKQADDLWKSFGGGAKGTQLLQALSQKDIPKTQQAFEKWAGPGGKSGLGLTKAKADELWTTLKNDALSNAGGKATAAGKHFDSLGRSTGKTAQAQKASVPVWAAAWDTIYSHTIGLVIRMGKNIPGNLASVRHHVANVWDGLRHDASSKFDDLRHNIAGKFDGIRHDIAAKIGDVRHHTATIWDGLRHDAASKFDDLRHNTASKFDGIRHDIAHSWDVTAGALNSHLVKPLQSGLKNAWSWITANFGHPFATFFTKTIPHWWDQASGFLGSHLVKPLQTGFKNLWSWITANFGHPVLTFFTSTLPHWWDQASGFLGSHLVKPLQTGFKNLWGWITANFGHPVLTFFTSTLPHWWDQASGFLTSHFVKPVQGALKNAWSWITANFGTPLRTFFTQTLPHWWDQATGFLTSHFVKPVQGALKNAWSWITANFGTPFRTFFTQTLPHWWDQTIGFFKQKFVTPIQNAFSGSLKWVKDNFFLPIQKLFTVTLPHVFTIAVGGIGGAWKKIEGALHDPIHIAVQPVKGLVQGAKKVVEFAHAPGGGVLQKAIDFLGGLHSGGLIPGKGSRVPGFGGGDQVLAMLEPGEAIVDKMATKRYAPMLAQMGVPGFANGGYVGVPGFAAGGKVDLSMYTNPVAHIKGLIPMRIDQGVDYGATQTSPLVALGDSRVIGNTNPGWPGGQFWTYQLLNGPLKGSDYFYAEHIRSVVKAGQSVKRGQHVADLIPGSPNMEMGFADSQGANALAKITGGYKEGQLTAAGDLFNRLLVALGAPSGLAGGRPITGKIPGSGLLGQLSSLPKGGGGGGPTLTLADIVHGAFPKKEWPWATALAKGNVVQSNREAFKLWPPSSGGAGDPYGSVLKGNHITQTGDSNFYLAPVVKAFVDAQIAASAASAASFSGPAGGATGTSMANGKQLYEYLLKNLFGGNKIAAAGATASIWGESQWNPFSKGTGGRGLIGWSPANTISNADFSGGMKTQLPAILRFVTSSGDSAVIAKMFQATSILQAANEWGVGVERFGVNDVKSTGLALAKKIAGLKSGGLVFDQGGTLAPGPNLVWNHTGKPETVVPVASASRGGMSPGERQIIGLLQQLVQVNRAAPTGYARALTGTLSRGASGGYYGG